LATAEPRKARLARKRQLTAFMPAPVRTATAPPALVAGYVHSFLVKVQLTSWSWERPDSPWIAPPKSVAVFSVKEQRRKSAVTTPSATAPPTPSRTEDRRAVLRSKTQSVKVGVAAFPPPR
jgi:hypothetical protein